MLYREVLENRLIHTYSDTFKVRQLDTGIIYDDAIDVVDHEYEETDIPMENYAEADESDYIDALRGFGVNA